MCLIRQGFPPYIDCKKPPAGKTIAFIAFHRERGVKVPEGWHSPRRFVSNVALAGANLRSPSGAGFDYPPVHGRNLLTVFSK